MSELQDAQKKLAEYETGHKFMKDINSIIRKAKSIPEAEQQLKEYSSKLTDTVIHTLLHPQYSYEKQGFQGWQLSNSSANITRLKARVIELEAKEGKREEIATTGGEQPEQEINGVTITKDYEADRVLILFPGKPTAEIIAELNRNGWRWAPSKGVWSRKLTRAAESNAERICKQVLPPAPIENNAVI